MAALLSGPNNKFNTKIEAIKSSIDACYGFHSDITPYLLITALKQQYINIEQPGNWNKVDLRDAAIMALTTRLNKSTSNVKAKTVLATPGVDKGEVLRNLAKWRTEPIGDKIQHDGSTWLWCPHHKHKNGLFDGLSYSSHSGVNHFEWKEKLDANDATRKLGRVDPLKETLAHSKPAVVVEKLKISDALKNAFSINL